HQQPSAARLEAACTALAQLHTVWRSLSIVMAVCPAVQRRLAFVEEWRRLLQSGWHPLAAAENSDTLRPIVERVWRQLAPAVELVPHRLQRWLGGNRLVQPCLCDLWHDHLLFEGDRLTGL